MNRRLWTALPAVLALGLITSACGGGGTAVVASDAPAAAPAPAADTAAPAAAASSADPADAGQASGEPAAQPASGEQRPGPGRAAADKPAAAAPAGNASDSRTSAPGERASTAAAAKESNRATAARPATARATAAAATPKVSAADQAAYDRTGGATDRGVTKDSIRLGSVNMHGAALANLFTVPVVRGNLATATSINDRGGILGRRLSIVDCDDGPGDVARAKACIKKLVGQDKIFSLIGGVDWATASIHSDLRQNNLPYVGAWAYSQTEWQDPFMFPTHMSMIHEAMAGANWVKNVLKPKRYGLICLTSPEMQLACNEVERILDGAGSKNVRRLDVSIAEPTMSPHVVSMRAAAPDHIVHYVINPATMAKFMIESEQQGYYPPQGISGNHLAAEVLGSLFGKHAAGRYWTNTTYKLWGSDFMAIMNKYARGNRGRNHHIVQSSYVGLNFLAQAAKAVGPNLTRERLMAQLNNGQVWTADASLDQKFSWAPTERFGDRWRDDLGQNREFMYKMTSVETGADPDGSPAGWQPDPGQFVIYARD